MSNFPASSHLSRVPAGAEMTRGQIDFIYNAYESGVLNNEIPFHQDKRLKSTVLYLAEKTSLPVVKQVGFLMALEEYAKDTGNEKWRNPKLRVQESKELKDTFQSIIKTPMDMITKSVGSGAKNISEPLTKPLIILAVIAVSGVVVYGGLKSGLIKKVARKLKK